MFELTCIKNLFIDTWETKIRLMHKNRKCNLTGSVAFACVLYLIFLFSLIFQWRISQTVSF